MASKIYRHPTQPTAEVPQIDLLTLVFDSELSAAQDDTVLHVEAANPANRLTKATLRDLAERIARGLRHPHGIGNYGSGKDVVTVISHGQILVPAAFYGIIAAGGVYSAASPSSTVSELARQVITSKSSMIICSTEHKDVAIQAARQCNVPLSRVLSLESTAGNWSLTSVDSGASVISSQKLGWEPITDPRALKDSLIVILWSSGTTGLPKGVMMSHLNFVAETFLLTLSSRQWAAEEVERVGLENFHPSEYRTLGHLPISHIAGLFGYLIGAHYSGGTVYWTGKYKWENLIKHAREYKITAFYTVPSIYLRIAKSRDEVGDAFKHVEGASTGAAPMDAELQRSANKRMGDGQNVFIGQTWGLSETTGAVTAPNRLEEPDATGSIGSILPCVEIRIVDEDMRDVDDPARNPGELLIRAPVVTNGYYLNEKATKEAFHDGWLRTGDIGVLKNRKLYIVDRKKELLKYKGLQVAPAELENLLFTHPHVREAAVVGVPAPDDPGTDWPRAYIVADSSKVTGEEILAWVKERVPQYKQLRGGVVFVDEIPKNAIGKFLRRELRERAKVEISAERRASKL